VTGPRLRATQKPVQELARNTKGVNVKAGAIEVAPHINLTEWISEDLDIYACDIYA
jgi:hypothetical protein